MNYSRKVASIRSTPAFIEREAGVLILCTVGPFAIASYLAMTLRRRVFVAEVKEKKESKNFIEKKEVVKEIQANMEAAKSVVFVDYRGLTVAEASELRVKAREAGVKYKVYKNNLVRIALNNMGIKELDEQLTGTLAVAFSNADEISAVKLIAGQDFKDKMEFKFGLMGTSVLSGADVQRLKDLPSKEVLVAQLMGLLQGGARGLASVINAVPRNLAVVVDARAKQLA